MKGSRHWNYQHGLFSGFSEYRYSAPLARKHKPIFKGEKRKSVISRVVDAMRDWRMSPFENEGAVRNGLRSALCLQGHPWAQADAEAALLVSEALSRLGARRPTWEEGQKEYIVPRENCSWCGILIPEEFLHGRFNVRFCSDVCAKSAITHRDYEDNRKDSLAYRSAWDIIERSKHPARPCRNCGKSFRPQNNHGTGEFCSQACHGRYRQTVAPRNCKQCQKRFQPRHSGIQFCSRACVAVFRQVDRETKECQNCMRHFRPRNSTNPSTFCCRECQIAYGRPRNIERDCEWCAKPFLAAMSFARSCSKTCATNLSNARAGRFPKRISPPLLDFILHQQGLRITTDRMAA